MAVLLSGYLISAIAGLVLAGWLVTRRGTIGAVSRPMGAAIVLSSMWAISVLAFGLTAATGHLLFSLVNLAWLWVLYGLFAQDGRHASLGPIRPVVLSLTFVEFLQIAITLTGIGTAEVSAADELVRAGVSIRLLFCAGALVLVHNLYVGASPANRLALRWPAAALAVLWVYELNYNTIVYLGGDVPLLLAALRGCVPLAMVGLLTLGAMSKNGQQAFRPSRAFAFQSFSLLLIGAYFLVMVVAFQGLTAIDGDFVRLAQLAFIAVASALALIVLPSRRMRGWLRVTATKHLFQHRYDYREEWLRFTRTMGGGGPEVLPLRERAVQALADITDSPAGLLLTPDEDGGLVLAARWQWQDEHVPAPALDETAARFFADSEYIVDLDRWRLGSREGLPQGLVPDWLAGDERAWALVPLLHYERLLGVVVLARPPHARTLDWEDFDLLRVIGRQLASYLAEQASHDALGEALRFEEFNRRIAFVMHDIKNLASQLSLLARNAERHADNPDFRADMLVTLRNSADKLNALLQRLGRYGAQAGEAAGAVSIQPMLRGIAERYRLQHAVLVNEGPDCKVSAHPEALEQALIHLVQNAVDATESGLPVMLEARRHDGDVAIEIVDSGSGMTPEFIRTRLFKPFHSSKPGGFGIGAFEARETIRAMGGRLDVESHEGLGTRFTIRLPLAERAALRRMMQEHEAKVA
ncbi:PEP-CTERM system histidine kinase PrsK [Altererythrobacter soli]|uniref:histidine kinase n=1 Tax=Croceibacterium soli TaxID=1739690 RepID=A0A6I4UQX0_9SPHN|nr:XrtA/PEP-CTERM system histidine kinase PrsK [Croceibacterium soli]MXP40836.1 PEP-CTERM system histidine kinase PrsK [Croceibacterium soli]